MRRLAWRPGAVVSSWRWRAITRRRWKWLAAGEADALAADDVLIAGYLAEKGAARAVPPWSVTFSRSSPTGSCLCPRRPAARRRWWTKRSATWRRTARDPVDLQQVVPAQPAFGISARPAHERPARAVLSGPRAARGVGTSVCRRDQQIRILKKTCAAPTTQRGA